MAFCRCFLLLNHPSLDNNGLVVDLVICHSFFETHAIPILDTRCQMLAWNENGGPFGKLSFYFPTEHDSTIELRQNHLDDRRLLGDGAKLVVEDPEPNDVQSNVEELFLHVNLKLERLDAIFYLITSTIEPVV